MPDRDPLRQMSKELFGREHALTLAKALLRSTELLNFDELVALTPVPRTTLFKELELLSRHGVLVKAQDRRNYYQRAEDHPYWVLVERLVSAAEAGTAVRESNVRTTR